MEWKGIKSEAGRKTGAGGGEGREVCLGREKETTEGEPSREVKGAKRGGGYPRRILTHQEEVTLGAERNEVRGQMAPSNGAHALAMGSASCPPPPLSFRDLEQTRERGTYWQSFKRLKNTANSWDFEGISYFRPTRRGSDPGE